MSNQGIIANNIKNIQEKIKLYAKQYGRDADDIALLAVSKFHSVESIEEAYHAGLRDFGENYIQEWREKSELCRTASSEHFLSDIRWHLIGPVQKNKVKYFNSLLHSVQSIHSLDIAQWIEKKWTEEAPLKVLIQLQVDADDVSKSGISFEEAFSLCEFLGKSQKLCWSGFMGIGPQNVSFEKRMELYTKFKKNTDHLASLFWSARGGRETPLLSLGMSDDMQAAIACGSHQVRIGSAIFGVRPQQK